MSTAQRLSTARTGSLDGTIGPQTDDARGRSVRRTLGVLGRGLVWCAVVAAGAVVLAALVVPRLTGAQTYTVLTGSMEPELSPGDIVVVKPTAIDDIALGDVVTWQIASGENATVTHRVVGLAVGADGGQRLVTQGDDNDVPDADLVRPVQLRGTVWYSVPMVGRAVAAVDGSTRTLIARLAAICLFLYAAGLVAAGMRDRRRARSSAAHSPGRRTHREEPNP